MAVFIAQKFLLLDKGSSKEAYFLYVDFQLPSLKIIPMLKWRIWGWHIVIPFSCNEGLRNGAVTLKSPGVKEGFTYLLGDERLHTTMVHHCAVPHQQREPERIKHRTKKM